MHRGDFFSIFLVVYYLTLKIRARKYGNKELNRAPAATGNLEKPGKDLESSNFQNNLEKPWIWAKIKKILAFCLSTGILVFGAPHGLVLIS